MIQRLWRLLISRKTAAALIIALLAVTVIGYVVPQSGATGHGPNRFGLPEAVVSAASALGLDRVYYSAWFVGLLSVSAVSLIAAMLHQARITWRRVRPERVPRVPRRFETAVAPDALDRHLRSAGYRRAADVEGSLRYTRHLWAQWGGVVLHLGLVVVACAAIVVVSTQAWAVVALAEGEAFAPSDEWANSEHGAFADELVLERGFALAEFSPTFWRDHEVKQLRSALAFADSGTTRELVEIGVNDSRVVDGVRFYQDQRFGQAFFLRIEQEGADRLERVDLEQPYDPETPSYGEIALGHDETLELKYYSDGQRQEMWGTPQLFGRHTGGEQSTDPVELAPGNRAQVGPLAVTLEFVRPWTSVSLVRDHGVSALFAGFFVLFAGSSVIYVTAGRELYVLDAEGGRREIRWRALRFPEMYEREYDELVVLLGDGEDLDG